MFEAAAALLADGKPGDAAALLRPSDADALRRTVSGVVTAAAGEPLPAAQDALSIRGHAF